MAEARRRRRLPLVLAALVVVVVGLWMGRSAWLEPWAARFFAREATARLGHPVRLDHLHGSWWSDLTLEGLAVEGVDRLPTLQVDRLTAAWHPAVVFGRLDSLHRITASGIEVVVDLRGERESSAAGWPAILERLPVDLPDLDVSGTLILRLDQGDLVFSGIALRHSGRDVIVSAAEVDLPWLAQRQSVTLRLRRDGDRLDLVEPARLGPLIVQQVGLVLGEQRQGLQIEADLEGTRLAFSIAPGDGQWEVQAQDLPPAALAPWLRRSPAVLTEITGTADVELRGGDPVTLDVDASDLSWRDLRCHHLTLEADLGNPLRLRRVEAASGDGTRVRLTDVVLADGRLVGGRARIDAEDLRSVVGRLGVTLPGTQAIAASGDLAFADRTVRVEAADLRTAGLAVSGSGRWRLADGTADLAATITADLAAARQALQRGPDLAGSLRLDATWSGRLDAPLLGRIGASGAAADVRIGEAAIPLIDLQVAAQDGIARLGALGGGPFAAWGLQARLTWTGQELQIDLPALALAREDERLAAEDTIAVRIADDSLTLEPTRWSSTFGDLTLGFGVEDGDLHARLDTDLDVAVVHRLIPEFPPSRGRLGVSLHCRGDLDAPIISLSLASQDLEIAGQAAGLHLDLHQDLEGIRIDRGDLSAPPYAEGSIAGRFPLRLSRSGLEQVAGHADGRLSTRLASLEVLFPKRFRGGDLDLSGTVSLRDDQPTLDLEAHLRDAVPVVTRGLDLGRVADPPHLDADLALRLGGKRLHADLAVAVDGDRALAVHAEARDEGDAWPLTGTADLDLDLGSLAQLSPEIVRTKGDLRGILTLDGTLGHPTWAGEVVLEDGELKLHNDVPTIAAINGTLAIDQHLVTVRDLRGEMGYAPVWIEAGSHLRLDPDDLIEVDLRLHARNALLVQNRDLRLRANTDDLRLHGPLRQLTASGSILIPNGLYSKPIELLTTRGTIRTSVGDGRIELFSLREPPLSDLVFDLDVRTQGDGSGLRIANNVVQAQCSVDLHLGGTGRTPAVTGRIAALDARAFLPVATMVIETASLTFPVDDPHRPRVELRGWAQIRQWRVSLTATGPLDDLAIEATSPGLSNEDAVLLLATGTTRAELDDPEGQRAMLSRVGTFVGKELFRTIRGPGDPDAIDTLLDRWTLEYGREVSEDGLDTIDTELRLNPFHKEPGYFLYGERDRWEDYNVGFTVRWRFGGTPPESAEP